MKHLRTLAVISGVAALAVTASPALAARGGGSTTVSNIWVSSVDGWSTGARAADAPAPTLAYGSTVGFGTTVEPIAGWEYAMILVSCYQDVDGDGTIDTTLWGPDVVLSSLQRPTAEFTLGGNSIWSLRGGGTAVCRADLDAYGVRGGKQTIRVLRSLPLTVRG